MLTENLKNEIINALKPIDPEMVILFGSYAWGTPDENSDIDLYVVTNDDFLPKNFNEKMEVKLKVSSAVDSIRDNYPVDLIVHTKKMYELFKKLNSSFSREIFTKGMKLL